MKKVTGYVSRNGNTFVYFENPKVMDPYNWIGVFLNDQGKILSVVNPYQSKFFALSWAKDAEKKEVEVLENLEEILWQRVSVGEYSNSYKTSTEYFKVFMIQQEDQHRLEVYTYKTGTTWHSYEGAVGYIPESQPFLVSKMVNGEFVTRDATMKRGGTPGAGGRRKTSA